MTSPLSHLWPGVPLAMGAASLLGAGATALVTLNTRRLLGLYPGRDG